MYIVVFQSLMSLRCRSNAFPFSIKCFRHVVVPVGFLVITILSQYNNKNIESIAIIDIINVCILSFFKVEGA